MKKERLATLGLIVITIWSALQYIVLKNVPDTVSSFAFLCVTNLLGFIVLVLISRQKLKGMKKSTLKKGAVLAIELMGFNFFLLIGSRNLDTVVISSVVSMYFIFITPILLLLRRKVSFRSAVATVVALIALSLIFETATGDLFQSIDVVYLIVADLFFAVYVITVSVISGQEDSTCLTLCQLLFATVFSLIGWGAEAALGFATFALPADGSFWVAVLFIGVFIRALYGVIQITSQKYVLPLKTSLIFSSEIIITLILSFVSAKLFHTAYTPVTFYQMTGCVLFICATLLIDDVFMNHLGYHDMDELMYVDAQGHTTRRSSMYRKIVNMTLMISMGALVVSTGVCLFAIQNVRNSTLQSSKELGMEAANTSQTALTSELEKAMMQAAQDKARLAEAKLHNYVNAIEYAASYAGTLYSDPAAYAKREVAYSMQKNGGKWAMQRSLEDESVTYASVREENMLLGNLEDLFAPIVQSNPEVLSLYIGTEDGLLVSYDIYSDYALIPDSENYYAYLDSEWYTKGKTADGAVFTDTYQDGYGRGLTITCVAPVHDKSGQFKGCIAVDILMENLNKSMVSDGIVEPNRAVMIDKSGTVIASEKLDPKQEDKLNIRDAHVDTPLKYVADTLQANEVGLTSTGEGSDAIYIAYSTIPLTQWRLCIMSPVADIIAPAVNIRDSIDKNTVLVVQTVAGEIQSVILNCLLLFALILLLVTVFVGKLVNRIVDPLKTLALDVQKISQGNFEQRTQVRTDDEIGNLARTFNRMTESLQRYIVDLKDVTAKEERIASELAVAAKIQASMLPTEFPDCDAYRLFATMVPAKEVGGDFYDFFLMDARHLAIVMADVSGKGVPAALFMAIGKALIKSHTVPGVSLGDVFTEVNHLLCDANSEGLFITAFEGVLDLATGEFNYVNAGHELPFICKAGETFEAHKIRAGFVLAGMEGTKYKAGSMMLETGDKIFQYTDGVTEATNAENELYGMTRLQGVLSRHAQQSPKAILQSVKADIDRFAGEAPQFDDITMLCLEYKHKCDLGE